jgi:Uroporphyrinogen-III decarboxylase
MATYEMTSRQRIIEATNHREPDVLPIDFGATGSTGISVIAYNQLKRYLAISGETTKLYDIYQQLALPEIAVIDRLGGDVLQVTRGFLESGRVVDDWKLWKLKDGSECVVPITFNPVMNEMGEYELRDGGQVLAKMSSDGWYFDHVYKRCAHVKNIDDIDKIKLTVISDEELKFIEQKARYLYETTDKALLFSFGGSILELSLMDWGHEKFFIEMALNPELVHYWFNKLTDSYMVNLEKVLNAIGKYIQIISFGDDLGTQEALQISPQMYRDLVKPYHARQFRYVRNHYPNVKVYLHSCGAIFDLIPDLIDSGVEILNPVQISAKGMNPKRLKQEFGKHITFWGGGANMQHTVNKGTPEEIREEVSELIEVFSPGGGYVFNQVHNIQANVPPEKIMAIYDTALKYR